MTGSPLHAPPIPRMAETEARRPHPIVHRRAYQDSFREHRASEAIVRKRRILFAGFVARMGEGRPPQRVMFGELVGSKGYSGGQEKGLDGSSEGGYVGLWNEIRRVAQGCSEGRHVVSRSRGGIRVVHAELACNGETQSCRATRKGCSSAIHRRHL